MRFLLTLIVLTVLVLAFAFSVFGILATFEPGVASAWMWRAGYGAAALTTATVIAINAMRAVRSMRRS